MEIIDTHVHLTSEKYDEHALAQIIREATAKGVTGILTLGTDIADSWSACKISQKYENVYFGVGIHPHEAKSYTQDCVTQARELLSQPKCVAVGEIGLDYYYEHSDREIQRVVFIKFLELAQEYQLPVSIHSRNAEQEVLQIIRAFADVKIVCHSYTGSLEALHKMLELGVYFSINGMVTFKKNENIVQLIKHIPLEKILLETDGPYLAPVPFRGGICEPKHLVEIGCKVAEILEMDVETLTRITTENARKIFRL